MHNISIPSGQEDVIIAWDCGNHTGSASIKIGNGRPYTVLPPADHGVYVDPRDGSLLTSIAHEDMVSTSNAGVTKDGLIYIVGIKGLIGRPVADVDPEHVAYLAHKGWTLVDESGQAIMHRMVADRNGGEARPLRVDPCDAMAALATATKDKFMYELDGMLTEGSALPTLVTLVASVPEGTPRMARETFEATVRVAWQAQPDPVTLQGGKVLCPPESWCACLSATHSMDNADSEFLSAGQKLLLVLDVGGGTLQCSAMIASVLAERITSRGMATSCCLVGGFRQTEATRRAILALLTAICKTEGARQRMRAAVSRMPDAMITAAKHRLTEVLALQTAVEVKLKDLFPGKYSYFNALMEELDAANNATTSSDPALRRNRLVDLDVVRPLLEDTNCAIGEFLASVVRLLEAKLGDLKLSEVSRWFTIVGGGRKGHGVRQRITQTLGDRWTALELGNSVSDDSVALGAVRWVWARSRDSGFVPATTRLGLPYLQCDARGRAVEGRIHVMGEPATLPYNFSINPQALLLVTDDVRPVQDAALLADGRGGFQMLFQLVEGPRIVDGARVFFGADGMVDIPMMPAGTSTYAVNARLQTGTNGAKFGLKGQVTAEGDVFLNVHIAGQTGQAFELSGAMPGDVGVGVVKDDSSSSSSLEECDNESTTIGAPRRKRHKTPIKTFHRKKRI